MARRVGIQGTWYRPGVTAAPTPLAPVARARWLLYRALAMDPGEGPYRLAEQLRGAWDGLPAVRRRIAAPTGAAPPSWPWDAAQGRALPASHRGALRRAADGLLRGELRLLGVDWPAGTLDAWDRDPVGGAPWPAVPARLVRFRHGARDPRLAWELLRLPHLQVLALAGAVLGDTAAAARARALLRSWLDHQRPFVGVGYAAGIECGHRAVSLSIVAGLLRLAETDAPLAARAADAVSQQMRWIERYPSRYSSAGNHRVAELAALVSCASLSPPLDPGGHRGRWAAELRQQVRRLILPDGSGAEQSPRYLAYVLEWLLVARRAAAEGALELGVDDRLAAAADFLLHLSEEAAPPDIGDADGAAVLAAPGAAPYVASVVGAVGRALRRPDLVPRGAGHDLRSAVLGLAPLRRRTARRGSRTFAHGGTTVLRWRAGRRDAVLIVDHGPLGLAPLRAHGHADALAVWLAHGGHPLLVDCGTFRYTGAPAWRGWLRGTGAHNTATVDGLDQAEPGGPFLWTTAPAVRLERVDLARRVVVASHDGFRARSGVLHRRQVMVQRPRRIEIEDRFEGGGDHDLAVAYHLAADLEVRAAGDGCWLAFREGRAVLGLELVDGPVRGALHRGAVSPGPGALAPSYNRIVAAPCLWLSGHAAAPARVRVRLTLAPVADTRVQTSNTV